MIRHVGPVALVLSLLAQLTAMVVPFWRAWFGWGQVVTVLAAGAGALVLLAVIPMLGMLIASRSQRINHQEPVTQPNGWLLLAAVLAGVGVIPGVGYAALGTVWLRVHHGWGLLEAFGAAFVGGLLAGALITTLLAVVLVPVSVAINLMVAVAVMGPSKSNRRG